MSKKNIWASRCARFARLRRAIRSITLCALRARAGASPAPTGGSASIPLAKKTHKYLMGRYLCVFYLCVYWLSRASLFRVRPDIAPY